MVATVIGSACVLLLALFDIHVRPEFTLPRQTTKPDPEQEARYERCVDRRTDLATRQAFARADNPDVQNTMIRMRQHAALEECRVEYPRREVTIHEPFRFNVIDLEWRFGDRVPR